MAAHAGSAQGTVQLECDAFLLVSAPRVHGARHAIRRRRTPTTAQGNQQQGSGQARWMKEEGREARTPTNASDYAGFVCRATAHSHCCLCTARGQPVSLFSRASIRPLRPFGIRASDVTSL